MAKLILSGSTSGSISLESPAVSGTTTLTLPTTTDTLVGKTTTDTLTNKTLTSPAIAGTPTGVGVLTSGTSVSASGTSVDFTSIPSWVKRITVMLNGVSTSGSSNYLIQLGSGSVTTSGYVSNASLLEGSAITTAYTTGIGIRSNNAASTNSGAIVLTNINGNDWVAQGVISSVNSSGSGAGTITSGGKISLGGVLDRVRVTTVNGTDTFDAGTINILFE